MKFNRELIGENKKNRLQSAHQTKVLVQKMIFQRCNLHNYF